MVFEMVLSNLNFLNEFSHEIRYSKISAIFPSFNTLYKPEGNCVAIKMMWIFYC